MKRSGVITDAQLKQLLANTSGYRKPRAPRPGAGQLEADIETAIVKAMQLDGWRAFKMQYSFDAVKKLTLGEPGMPDHLFIRYRLKAIDNPPCIDANVLWWEFKASTRRRKRKELLSSIQGLWIQHERKEGALIWVAGADHPATIAGAAQHYLDSGLASRREVFEALTHG